MLCIEYSLSCLDNLGCEFFLAHHIARRHIRICAQTHAPLKVMVLHIRKLQFRFIISLTRYIESDVRHKWRDAIAFGSRWNLSVVPLPSNLRRSGISDRTRSSCGISVTSKLWFPWKGQLHSAYSRQSDIYRYNKRIFTKENSRLANERTALGDIHN